MVPQVLRTTKPRRTEPPSIHSPASGKGWRETLSGSYAPFLFLRLSPQCLRALHLKHINTAQQGNCHLSCHKSEFSHYAKCNIWSRYRGENHPQRCAVQASEVMGLYFLAPWVIQTSPLPATSALSLISSMNGSKKLYEVLNTQGGRPWQPVSYFWQEYHSFFRIYLYFMCVHVFLECL